MLPPVHRLNTAEPILQRIDNHPWENKVTFNPACILVEGRSRLDPIIAQLPFATETKNALRKHMALCFLFYRAQGRKTDNEDFTRSSIGLAVLAPDLTLLARHSEPVIRPDQPYEDLGVEDPRLTFLDGRFYLIYAAYSTSLPENIIRIACAGSTDLVHWEKHGLLPGDINHLDNKNAMLFPETIGGKYIMLHRPMKGDDAMCIHWAESDAILGEWKSRGVFMKARSNAAFINTWIGGGAPPLKLPDGRWLIIYHIGNRKADGTREYDLGIAVADLTRPDPIVKRDEPLLRPTTHHETTGDTDLGVNNVVFICGAYFYNGDLIFPYAGADSVVLGGMISGKDLEEYFSA